MTVSILIVLFSHPQFCALHRHFTPLKSNLTLVIHFSSPVVVVLRGVPPCRPGREPRKSGYKGGAGKSMLRSQHRKGRAESGWREGHACCAALASSTGAAAGRRDSGAAIQAAAWQQWQSGELHGSGHRAALVAPACPAYCFKWLLHINSHSPCTGTTDQHCNRGIDGLTPG